MMGTVTCASQFFAVLCARLNQSECLPQPVYPLVRGLLGLGCDCAHCVEPLKIERHPVEGRSDSECWFTIVGVDVLRLNSHGLTMRYFFPVAPAVYRQTARGKADVSVLESPFAFTVGTRATRANSLLLSRVVGSPGGRTGD